MKLSALLFLISTVSVSGALSGEIEDNTVCGTSFIESLCEFEADPDRRRRIRERRRRARSTGRILKKEDEEEEADGFGDGGEVGEAGGFGGVVHHDVELGGEDEGADAGEHAVDDGGGDGAEELAGLEEAGGDLDEPGEQDDGAEHGDAMLLDDLEDDDGEARGWPADLQRAAGEHADNETAEDTGDEAGTMDLVVVKAVARKRR